MYKSYLLTALRNLRKHRLFSAINIFGLALGLGVCLVTIGHISYETTFEDCHENLERIYRVNNTYTSGDTIRYSSRAWSGLGPALAEEIPEIEKTAVFRVMGFVDLSLGEESYKSKGEYSRSGYTHDGNVFAATPAFLDIFTLPLLQGDRQTALREPNTALITEKAARELFPSQNPIGQRIKIGEDIVCYVTGVLKDIPPNTQVLCDLIVSYATLENIGHELRSWESKDADWVYVMLREDADSSAIVGKIRPIADKYLPPELAAKYTFEIQPLDDIYFSTYGSGRYGDLGPHGEISMMYEMGITILLILILAIANFVNLSTARSSDRMKEVGMRKVLGASRFDLIKQFLGESIVITVISVAFGLVMYELFKAWITPLLPREFFADFYNNFTMIWLLVALTITVGILAGFYPALYLSRFKPLAVLQSKTSFKSSKSVLRRALVILQFVIAITFVTCTIIMVQQINFLTHADYGFERENIIIVKFTGDNTETECRRVKAEFLKDPHALAVTAANSPPGMRSYHRLGVYLEEERRDMIALKDYAADYDFLSTYGIEVIDGRTISPDIPGDESISVLVSEQFAKQQNLANPIRRKLYRGDDKFYEVVGIVKEFYGSLQVYGDNNGSLIYIRPDKWRTLSVKIPEGQTAESITALEDIWKRTMPGKLFEYSLIEDEIVKSYGDLGGSTKMFAFLGLIAISMACLGIFGLVTFTAEQKTKQIGIRKVLGASEKDIVILLARELIILITIAIAIAMPLGYTFADLFLEYFVLKVPVGIWTFLFTGLSAVALALFAAGFQALKAAKANAIDALRYE